MLLNLSLHLLFTIPGNLIPTATHWDHPNRKAALPHSQWPDTISSITIFISIITLLIFWHYLVYLFMYLYIICLPHLKYNLHKIHACPVRSIFPAPGIQYHIHLPGPRPRVGALTPLCHFQVIFSLSFLELLSCLGAQVVMSYHPVSSLFAIIYCPS